jgi:hypothetical protein
MASVAAGLLSLQACQLHSAKLPIAGATPSGCRSARGRFTGVSRSHGFTPSSSMPTARLAEMTHASRSVSTAG